MLRPEHQQGMKEPYASEYQTIERQSEGLKMREDGLGKLESGCSIVLAVALIAGACLAGTAIYHKARSRWRRNRPIH